MKLLLTSSGISNPSIYDVLVDLLGKPVAESGEKAAAPSAAVRRLEATLAHLLELKRRLDAARD